MTSIRPARGAANFVGTWVVSSLDGSFEYRVRLVGKRLQVSVVDREDGERFIVRDVACDGTELRFTMRSRRAPDWLQYSDELRWRLRADGSLSCVILSHNSGLLVPDRPAEREHGTFVGTWLAPDALRNSTEYRIKKSGEALEVSVVDRDDGERFVVSHLRQQGDSLRFRYLVPSTCYLLHVHLRLRADGVIDEATVSRHLRQLVRASAPLSASRTAARRR